MASKTYTAQKMREMEDKEKFKCSFVTRTLNGGVILDCTNDVRAMLRQAADAMEREKKYEFSVKEFGGYVQPLHDDSMSSSFLDGRAVGDENYVIVRREVGEWEEVKDA